MMNAAVHMEWIGDSLTESCNPLQAHESFIVEHLKPIREKLEKDSVSVLIIVLCPALSEHDDWRGAIAADLARQYTPKRVNIAAGGKGAALDRVVEYLSYAPGVTGHYIQAHD